MKVLQINNYNYLKGGSEKVYQVSIDVLRKYGHEVRYFSVSDTKNTPLCDGISVDVKSWREAKGFWGKIQGVKNFVYNKKVAKELEKLILEFRPDVAHLHIFYGTLSNSIVRVLHRHKIPMVQSVHEFRLLCPAYTCLDSKLNICEQCADSILKLGCIKKRCIKHSLPLSIIASVECFIRDMFYCFQRNFAAFIMVSKFIEDKHLQYFPSIRSKCHQIYNSVDTAMYAQYVCEPQQKEGYYLYLGRLSYEKGIETLVNTFLHYPDLKLKIAGTGPILEEMKKKVSGSGVNNIEFLGFISGEELYNIIAKARYTMVPSEWYENNPLSVIESLVLGTPVIGSKVGGIPELIEEGYNGFLHLDKNIESLSDALDKSIRLDEELYRIQCKHAREQAVKRFDNVVYYENMINVYRKVCENG